VTDQKRIAAALELNEIGVLAVSRESETWTPDFSSDGRARLRAASPKGSAWLAAARFFEERDLRVVCVAHGGNGRAGGLAVAEIAVGLAEQGREVLVIDADIVRPLFGKPFQYQPDEGLVDMVMFGTSAGAAIRKTPHERVRVLTAGSPPIDASEVYGARELVEILAAFRAEWDVVLLHAPLLGLDGRPCEVVQRSDATFIVLPAGVGSAEEIGETLASLDAAPRVLGILRVRPASEVVDAAEEPPAPAEPVGVTAGAARASDTTRAMRAPAEVSPAESRAAAVDAAVAPTPAAGTARARDAGGSAAPMREALGSSRPIRSAGDRQGARSIALVVTLGGLVALGVGVGVAYLVQRDPSALSGLLTHERQGEEASDESFASDPARARSDEQAQAPGGEIHDAGAGTAPGGEIADATGAGTAEDAAAGVAATAQPVEDVAAVVSGADPAASHGATSEPAGTSGGAATPAQETAQGGAQDVGSAARTGESAPQPAAVDPGTATPDAGHAQAPPRDAAPTPSGPSPAPTTQDRSGTTAPAGSAAPAGSERSTSSPAAASSAAEVWGVHLSSFPYLNQAADDAELWRRKGYSVTIVSKEIPGKGLWYRVILGSYKDKRSATDFSEELKANEGLDYCAVVKFSPQ
jgi:Mrp family chromosome partitioning ATPase/cell division protein FtsN